MNFEGFQDLIRRVAVEWYKAAQKEIIEMDMVIDITMKWYHKKLCKALLAKIAPHAPLPPCPHEVMLVPSKY